MSSSLSCKLFRPIRRKSLGGNHGYREEQASPAVSSQKGKVQKEELDFWRGAGERGPVRADEGAGRNRQGFSLPRDKRAAPV